MTKNRDGEPPRLHPRRAQNPAFIAAGDKKLRKLQKTAWDEGWFPKETKSGVMWLSPDQRGQVMIHKTASDHRAYANALAEFRRAGLDA